MGSLTLLKSRIASDLKRTDLTTHIAYAIADAVGEYKGKHFHFNQARDTFSTVAGTEFYTTTSIPDDIGEIDALTLTTGGNRYVMQRVSFDRHETMAVSTTATGQPSCWSWYAQQLRLYPIPDAVYTVTISYLQRIDLQTDDGAETVWTTQAENMIRACAEKILYRDVLQAPQLASLAQSAESAAYRRLMREAHQFDGCTLQPSGI